jgi:hypothetical protein
MNVRAQWIALLLIGLLLGGVACSSTSEDDVEGGDGDGDSGQTGDGDGDTGDGDGDTGDGDGDTGDGDGDTGDGDGDNGDGDGDTGDGDGDVNTDDDGGAEGIVCGAEMCPENGCCADPFQSLCGAAVGARGCIKPPEPDENSDPRCPSISIVNLFTISSCCIEGMCGVNAMGLGAPTDCTELSEFKMAVDQMSGGMAPFSIPAPQACE